MTRWESPKDAMPWVGLYSSGASLLCTFAMAADAFQGFRQWRLWFPCRFFTINALSITLIAIAMKLPVDLTTDMPGIEDWETKYFSIYFLVTMLASFLPSLGLMGDKELLTNIIAFGILIITISANVLIQSFTGSVYDPETGIVLSMISILLPLSVYLIVPTSIRILERQYKELHQLGLTHQEVTFSYKELIHNVKKYWIMAETGNPQFVIACSSVSYTLGVICSLIASVSLFRFLYLYSKFDYSNGYSSSDYMWSIPVLMMIQTFGVVLGSIAPIFRCFTTINHFNISRKWSMNHLNVFKVEKYWTQRLKEWKRTHVCSHIPGRHLKKVCNSFKNLILNFCIAFQIMLVVTCNTISLLPRCFLILHSWCWRYLCVSLLKRFSKEKNESDNNIISELEEYESYVLCFEKESQLSKTLLTNTIKSITKLIRKSEKKEPRNLVKLLMKSTGFNGVQEFDSNQDPQEHQNSWSLVIVTLTAIAIALPNIENSDVQQLLASMREGLHFVGHIEENLNANTDDLVKARKTSGRLWAEVEVYEKWLHIDLQCKAHNGNSSKLILKWLGEEAIKVVKKFLSTKNDILNRSEHKFIAMSSMYRISKTILHRCDKLDKWPEDKELFNWISTLNADILCACFTNLPRVIKMKCHHDAIEKREDGVRGAAQLLGESKRILKILNHRPLPKTDENSMAYIDKWRALPKCHILNGCASSVEIRQGSSTSTESHSITVM